MRAAFVFALVLVPSIASAQARPVVHQRLVGQLGPTGAEHMVAAGVRADLGDPDEMLFWGAHAEAGVVSHVSPIYAMTGGYVQVSPFAFLILRAAMLGTEVWSFGADGAGHFPSQDQSLPDLGGANGVDAGGWNVQLSTILQGAVPIGPLRAILWNELSFEHVALGDAPFHYAALQDAVLARNEWVMGNWTMLVLEIPIGDTRLRLGAYDDVRHVPRSGWLANQVGGVAMLSVERPIPEIGELLPFVRVGAYTHHERRAGDVAALFGLMIRYELAPAGGIP